MTLLIIAIVILLITGTALATKLARTLNERDEAQWIVGRAQDAQRWLSEMTDLEPLWQFLFATTYEKTFPKIEGPFEADEITLTLYHCGTIDEARDKIRKLRHQKFLDSRSIAIEAGFCIGVKTMNAEPIPEDRADKMLDYLQKLIDEHDDSLLVGEPHLTRMAQEMRTFIDRERLAEWHKEHNVKTDEFDDLSKRYPTPEWRKR